jgi:hypothetical protein
METNAVSFQRLTYFTVLVFLAVYVLIVGQTILTPLAFGALFAFMLKPVCDFMERWIKWRTLAALLTIFAASIPVIGVTMFFSTQFVNVVRDMPSIKEKLNAGAATLYELAKQFLGYTEAQTDQFISEQLTTILDAPLSFLGVGVSSSTAFFAGFFLCIIYIFLFLLYRPAFKNFILVQTGQPSPEGANRHSEIPLRTTAGYPDHGHHEQRRAGHHRHSPCAVLGIPGGNAGHHSLRRYIHWGLAAVSLCPRNRRLQLAAFCRCGIIRPRSGAGG